MEKEKLKNYKETEAKNVKASIEQITPEMAHEYLKSNHDNRKDSNKHIEWLASQMTAGKWMLTHQGIAFDDKDHLRDGQHRLKAIIKSMTTQPMLVVRGLSADTFTVMDTGKNRGAQDVLYIEGYKEHSRELAIMARAVLEWDTGAYRQLGRLAKVTNFMILNCVQQNEAMTDTIAKFMTLQKDNKGIMAGSMAATFVWIFAHLKDSDFATAEDFFERLYTGANLDQHSPILHLRNFFLKEKMQVNKIPKVVKIAILIKGWNFHRVNQPTPRMWNWISRQDVFPIPR